MTSIQGNHILRLMVFLACLLCTVGARGQSHEYYQITVYRYQHSSQEARIDSFLKRGYIPAAHRRKISNIGVFKPIVNDTGSAKSVYVFTPLKSMDQIIVLRDLILDPAFRVVEYAEAPHNDAPFVRIENILLRAFSRAPTMKLPKLRNARQDRVYELRSYESATEMLHRNKVRMFNEGGEIRIFDRLNFNAIFYGEVLAGCRMPNLMYMTSFESREDRDKHWKSFSEDAEWKRLSPQDQYKNNVSKIDIILMRPTSYSDF